MAQCLTASFLLMVLSSPVLIVTVISASLVMAPVIATQRWVLELAVLPSRARTFKQCSLPWCWKTIFGKCVS